MRPRFTRLRLVLGAFLLLGGALPLSGQVGASVDPGAANASDVTDLGLGYVRRILDRGPQPDSLFHERVEGEGRIIREAMGFDLAALDVRQVHRFLLSHLRQGEVWDIDFAEAAQTAHAQFSTSSGRLDVEFIREGAVLIVEVSDPAYMQRWSALLFPEIVRPASS